MITRSIQEMTMKMDGMDYFHSHKIRHWSFKQDIIQNRKKQEQVINVDDFIKYSMNNLSHSMNGNKCKSILDKYYDKENKYSFTIIKKSDYKCYVDKDELKFPITTLSGFHEINMTIVDNLSDEVHENTYPLIVRFGKANYSDFSSREKIVEPFADIGYPFKIWITKDIKVENIYNKFINDKEKDKLK